MPIMRTRRLLLAAAALSTVLGACEKKRPIAYANSKMPQYPYAPIDAASDATPPEATDAGEPVTPPTETK